jgi:hypothetical protein
MVSITACQRKELKCHDKKLCSKNKRVGNVQETIFKSSCHAFEANTNSSNRTKIAKKIFDKELENNCWKPSLKQIMKFNCSKIDISADHCLSENALKTSLNFFVTDLEDSNFYDGIQKLKTKCKKEVHVHNVYENTKVVDTTSGAFMMHENNNPVFILLPRQFSITKCVGQADDAKILHHILGKLAHTQRGIDRLGICGKYATAGMHTMRGGPGVKEKIIKAEDERQYNAIVRMMKRAEHAALSVMPRGTWQGLQRAKAVVPWQGIGPKQRKEKVQRKNMRQNATQI